MVFSIQPGNKMTEHVVENTEFTLAEKSTQVSKQVKTMLVCFFDHNGIVLHELIAKRQTVNEQCYLEVLTRLQEYVQKTKTLS
jgi:hypothetical protein